jgi:hypothetical protein
MHSRVPPSAVLWIRNNFFRIRIHKKICSCTHLESVSYTNILARNFSKWFLSLLSCVFWNLYVREKMFPIAKKNRYVFSLARVWSAIFHFFLFYNSVGSESELFSDSNPDKTYGLGSTTLLVGRGFLSISQEWGTILWALYFSVWVEPNLSDV